MLKFGLPAAVLALALGMSAPAQASPNATASVKTNASGRCEVSGYRNSMRAEGYRLNLFNKVYEDIAYDIWDKGTEFYYYIWKKDMIGNCSDPEVVVRFENPNGVVYNDNIAQLCYYSAGFTCDGSRLNLAAGITEQKKARAMRELRAIPEHVRTGTSQGICTFPWQTASDGSQCGSRATILR